MVLYGFYVLKNSFFEDMNDPYLKNNKDGHRPFYYCFKEDNQDQTDTDIFWMIPLSSRIEKYQMIIDNRTAQNKPCDIIHITTLPTGKKSAFLIQDIFPITEKYIEREYTLGNTHLILPYESEIKTIEQKAKKILSLIKLGVQLTPTSPNVMLIYEKLL